MLQETTINSSHISLLSHIVTIVLAIIGTLSVERFKRRREPVEVSKLLAEREQISVSTVLAPADLTLEAIKELREYSALAETRRAAWITREELLVDQRNEWRRKYETLEFESNRRLVQMEADCRAAIMFMEQLHAAANLKGVRLADYSPKQLKDAIDKMKTELESNKGELE